MFLCHRCKQADIEGSLSCMCACMCACQREYMSTSLAVSHFSCWLGCAGDTSVPWNTFVHSNIYDHIIFRLYKTGFDIIEHLDCSETMVLTVFSVTVDDICTTDAQPNGSRTGVPHKCS